MTDRTMRIFLEKRARRQLAAKMPGAKRTNVVVGFTPKYVLVQSSASRHAVWSGEYDDTRWARQEALTRGRVRRMMGA